MKDKNSKLSLAICFCIPFALSGCCIHGILKKLNFSMNYERHIRELDTNLRVEFPGSRIFLDRGKKILFFGISLATVRKDSKQFYLKIAKVPNMFTEDNKYLSAWADKLSSSLFSRLDMPFPALNDVIACIGPDDDGQFFLARYYVAAPGPENSFDYIGFSPSWNGYIRFSWSEVKMLNDNDSVNVFDDAEHALL